MPSWIWRADVVPSGRVTVAVEIPKVPGFDHELPGIANCTWLNRLKNSNLVSTDRDSVNENFRVTEKSTFLKLGPITEFRPAVPNLGVEGAANAHGLNQLRASWTTSAARPP